MNDGRIIATRYIWVAYFFVMIVINGGTLFYGHELGVGPVILAVVATLAAAGSTGFVWGFGGPHGLEMTDNAAQKQKRRAKVDALLDMLSEEDRATLLSRLEDDYGHNDEMILSEDGELMRRKG